uniref:WWC1-like helical hairpin domain-containing protein n=1 Tax=Hippocampus comes TaxID=109280 RepID=A0A3Q3DN47_HIPCM
VSSPVLSLPHSPCTSFSLVQIAKLDSEAWPGLLDPERDRLILINEKEELLKELQYVRPRQRLEPNDAQKLETEKKRLERDLQAARDNQSKALTERSGASRPGLPEQAGQPPAGGQPGGLPALQLHHHYTRTRSGDGRRREGR